MGKFFKIPLLLLYICILLTGRTGESQISINILTNYPYTLWFHTYGYIHTPLFSLLLHHQNHSDTNVTLFLRKEEKKNYPSLKNENLKHSISRISNPRSKNVSKPPPPPHLPSPHQTKPRIPLSFELISKKK